MTPTHESRRGKKSDTDDSESDGGWDEKKLKSEELAKRYSKWGLGRGVDITKPTPWLEKTSFQVRDVRLEDLIETDEGGLLKGYSDLVNNSTTVYSQIRSGVKAPDVPLSIGVDLEYTRTDCSSNYIVGLKVKNRTISYRMDFDDLPTSWIEEWDEAKEHFKSQKGKHSQSSASTQPQPGPKSTGRATHEDEPDSRSADTKQQVASFDSRLCAWLTHCLRDSGKSIPAGTPLHKVLIKGKSDQLIDSEECMTQLQLYVFNFIRYVGVTHYICAIELGALEFSILTEKEYENKVSASGNASLNTQLYGGLEASAKWSHFRKFKAQHTERKTIGKMTKEGDKDIVKEKDEAVIGCQIRPVSSLVQFPLFRKMVEKAVEEYIKTTLSTAGPYLIISCIDDKPMYLAVDPKTKELTITDTKEEAEEFTVTTVNETHHRHELEFCLTSSLSQCKKKERGTPQCDEMAPLDYTMEIRTNRVTGRVKSPPRMRLSTDYRQTRLLLRKRSDHRISCSTTDWIKGTDAYYIQCIHPLARKFLCVKERESYRKQQERSCLEEITPGKIEDRLKVCVRGSSSVQRDGSHYYMLFRLLHTQIKTPSVSVQQPIEH